MPMQHNVDVGGVFYLLVETCVCIADLVQVINILSACL